MSRLPNDWQDCGGTVNWQGVCSCELVSCEACGATYHTDAGQLRYCSGYGQICADSCGFICNDECCMPPECFDNRDR